MADKTGKTIKPEKGTKVIKAEKLVKTVKTEKAVKADKPAEPIKVTTAVKTVKTEKATSRRLSKSKRKHIRRMKEAARRPDPVQNQPAKSPRKPTAAVKES